MKTILMKQATTKNKAWIVLKTSFTSKKALSWSRSATYYKKKILITNIPEPYSVDKTILKQNV